MKVTKPLILITNDDGIVAPGIRALVEVASSLGDVVVVAPDSPQSGQGHAITIEDPIRLKRVNVFDNIEAYECTGTPVDCVKMATNILFKGRQIDLCVSGINHGSNASINILYSGTMSAAMESSLEGIPSIGFSLLDFGFDADFTNAKQIASTLIAHVLENGMNDGLLWNVNIPKNKEIQGIKVCRQAKGNWVEEYQEGTDPRGQKYYWLTGMFKDQDGGNDTDIAALEAGYASLVPSGHDLTVYKAIDSNKSIEKIKF